VINKNRNRPKKEYSFVVKEHSFVAKEHSFEADRHSFAAEEPVSVMDRLCSVTEEHLFAAEEHSFLSNGVSFLTDRHASAAFGHSSGATECSFLWNRPLLPPNRFQTKGNHRCTQMDADLTGRAGSLRRPVSFRYAWAERALKCGYPERFAQQALGHNSKAVHRAYAKRALMKIPSLEDYEQQVAAKVDSAAYTLQR
jgi:hypothetical protein